MVSYLNLHEILPSLPEIDYEHYVESERDIIAPALMMAGYRLIGSFYTGDGDSFGPLTRCIRTDKGIVVYG